MDMVALRPIKMESLPKTNKNNSKAKPSKSKPPTLFNKQTEDAASGNGHVKRDQLFPISATDFILKKNAERLRVEESIKSEVLRTLSDRAARYLQVQSSCLIPDGPFAAHLVECVEQFRDGHYLGCIALTQAVLEAVIRHVWQVKLKTKPYQDGSFDKNLKALHKKKFISDEWKTKLDQMWVERYAFHHLRPSIECEQRNLEETARKSLTLLNELVREIPWHQIDAASRNCE